MALKVIKLILAESSLELVPRDIVGHPAVLRTAQRRGKRPTEILLDVSLHYHAMKKLRNRHKRGRPDIVHVTLLELLSSPLNLEGRLRIYVHTVNDYVIIVDPKTRIPRNYNRFVGLIEQLLTVGKVPPDSEKPLMEAVAMNFTALLKHLGKEEVILLSEKGELVGTDEVCQKALEEDLPIVIGGFPHGDFSEEVLASAKYTYSIYPKPLDTWVVASRITAACEKLLKILL
ncbi:MAG: 16S rRNA methyltransferase [Desulfurococcales archaeon]|nr:16S rRNA methyltransferase [Desulfurococcales archaeon]